VTGRSLLIAAAWLVTLPAAAQETERSPADAALTSETGQGRAERLTDEALGETRGGLSTPLGLDIGFGASVRTYVDGKLALETQLTWTAAGAQAERVFESDAARTLTPGPLGEGLGGQVHVAPGTSVVHDLTENRIASVVLNTAHDRTIRQDTDVRLHLPQLPEIQQRIAAERLSQSLQALSPAASGLGQ
jgi:hypothetical protein